MALRMSDDAIRAEVARFAYAPLDFVEVALVVSTGDKVVLEHHLPSDEYALTITPRHGKEYTLSLTVGEWDAITGSTRQ